MHMLKLEPEGLAAVYQQHLLRDFPPIEQKPLPLLLELCQAGRYCGYGFYEGRQLLGYAFFALPSHQRDILLDYLAVVPQLRNQGLGSQFLAMIVTELGDRYRALLLEVEDPAYGEDEADQELRRRRIGFYLRNGMELRGLKCFVQDGYFLIMARCLFGPIGDREIQASLTDIYTAFFGLEHLPEKVAFGEKA